METTKKILEQVYQELCVPLPKEAVTQHPTKPYLSTINAIYVVERLNQVFGVGKWVAHNEVVSAENGWVIVKSRFRAPDYNIEVFDVFGGNDNKDPGDAYKGACTDALTKIGSYLGIGMDVWKDKAKEGQTKPAYRPKVQQTPKTAPASSVKAQTATIPQATSPAAPASQDIKEPADQRKAKITELMLKIDPGLKGKSKAVWDAAIWGRTKLQTKPENLDEILNRLEVVVSELPPK